MVLEISLSDTIPASATIPLSPDKRIQLSCNSLIVQLYEYNIVFPSPLFTMCYNSLFV